MIRPLRRCHFFIWRILVVVFPILFCLAILLRPASTSEHDDINEVDFSFMLSTLTTDMNRLTVELKNPLRVPSCIVYASYDSRELLLGKLDRKGSYHFDIPTTPKAITVRLYDAIHKKEITRAEVSLNNE